MELRFQFNTDNIDWSLLPEILKKGNMGFHSAEKHQRAFEKSHTVIFVFDNAKLIGFGRAISDGEYQAAIYDVAILPEYQRMGIGKTIMDLIIERTPGCNYILYSSIGKEAFYQKLNFSRMKTGMALFVNKELMQTKGFTE